MNSSPSSGGDERAGSDVEKESDGRSNKKQKTVSEGDPTPAMSLKEACLGKSKMGDSDMDDSEGEGDWNRADFSPEFKEKLRRKCAQAVIIKVLGRNFWLPVLENKIRLLWRLKGDLELVDLGEGFTMVHFDCVDDMKFVLEEGPWIISGHYLMVRSWIPEFSPETAEFGATAKVVTLQEVSKQAKSWGLRSHGRMQRFVLPFEIVASILSWLPVKSLLRFRCVCKEWHSLTCNPNFIKEHNSHAQALGRLALICRSFLAPEILLYDFCDDGDVTAQGFSVRVGDQNAYTMSNPVNGLVCVEYRNSYMCDDGGHYLMNPATRELAKIPTSGNEWGTIGLGFDSSTGRYKLVKLFIIEGCLDGCGCKVLEVGTQEWRQVGGVHCMMPSIEPVLLNGSIHWISCPPTENDNFTELTIMAFNLKDENFRSMPVPREYGTLKGKVRLVECEGLLCLVKIPGTDSDSMADPGGMVRIWRLEDYATCRWREAHCSEMRNHTSIDGRLSLVGIRGHEMLMVANNGGGFGSIWGYDLRTRDLHERYNIEYPIGLHFLTESLVSPRYLAGNPSFH